MATITEKIPFTGATGQCLILDSRERLIYPFNLGNYSEIRWGMFWSTTSGSANNTPVTASDLIAQNAISNQIYFGFCNFNTGAVFPGASGAYDYIGTVGRYNGASCGIFADTSNVQVYGGASAGAGANFKVGITDLTGGCNLASGFGDNGFAFRMACPSVAQTGTTLYAGFFGMRLIFSGSKDYGMQAYTNFTTYTSNVSASNLRTNIANLGDERTAVYTGFFTSGSTEAAGRLMSPNSLYIYMPMFNTRLRVHNLIVERYA